MGFPGSKRPQLFLNSLTLVNKQSRQDFSSSSYNQNNHNHKKQSHSDNYSGFATRALIASAAIAPLALNKSDDRPEDDPQTREQVLYEISQQQQKEDQLQKYHSIDTDDDDYEQGSKYSLSRLLYLGHTYVVEPISTIIRFLHLVFLFAPVILSMPMVFLGPTKSYGTKSPDKLTSNESYERRGAELWFRYLAWTMEMAGPSFIKLGQWAASRTDIFPDLLTTQLSEMHSNAKQHSLAATKRIVEKSFGGEFDFDNDIFEAFIEKPIGVGAIAQVYKAKLKKDFVEKLRKRNKENERKDQSAVRLGKLAGVIDTPSKPEEQAESNDNWKDGGWVAVKVLHPRVAITVERDISIMQFFASILNSLPSMEWLSLPGEVETFASMMRQQMDLRIESTNLEIFRRNFGNDGPLKTRRKDVQFPKPYLEVSSRGVLVEEFISAIPMTQILKNASGGENKMEKLISSKGLDSFLKMLLLDNFIHADLHPGNIYVRFYKREWLEDGKHYTIGDVDVNLGSLGGGSKKWDSNSGPNSDANRLLESDVDPRIEEVTQKMLSLAGDKQAWQKELAHLLKEGYQPQLCFIDVGLITELNQTNRKNFIDLFLAIAQFDGYKVGELMVERSRTPETAIDADFFALKTQRLVDNIKQRTFALGNVRVGDLLSQMLTMVRAHHVRMEPDFVTVVLSVLLLEGIGRQLDPQMDLFKSSLPILRQLGRMESRQGIKFDKNMLSMVKVWLAIETRQFITASIQDIHNIVKYDFLCPNR